MNNDKLLKLDGEKIKLYVTKSKTLPKLLKNSGSLIVLHDDDDNTNYEYLGNEMIAGGWGFNNEEQKKLAISYMGTIPTDVYNLQQDLENEITERKDQFEVLNNVTLNNYVRKNTPIDGNGSDQNNLYFSSSSFDKSFYVDNDLKENENRFDVKNILSLLKPAEYKDIKVNNISQEIEVGFFENQEFKQYNDIVIKNNICYVPFESIMSKYTVSIDYDKNDSGGIKSLLVSRYLSTNKLNNDIYGTTEHYIRADEDELDNNEIISKTNLILKWNNEYAESNDSYLLFDVENDYDEYKLFKKFSGIINETPVSKYKKFPLLEDFPMYSIENIIKEHELSIDYVEFKASYLFFYNNPINDNVNNGVIPEKLQFNKSYKFTNKWDNNVLITDNKIDFEVNFELYNTHFLSFALPSEYYVKDIHLISNNNLYNITGLFKIIKNIGISMNPFAYDKRYIKAPYSFYYMYSDLDFLRQNFTVSITFDKSNIYNKSIIVPQYLIDRNSGLYELFDNYTEILRNNEFDGSHWTNAYPEQFTNWLSYDIEGAEEHVKNKYLEKTLSLVQ